MTKYIAIDDTVIAISTSAAIINYGEPISCMLIPITGKQMIEGRSPIMLPIK